MNKYLTFVGNSKPGSLGNKLAKEKTEETPAGGVPSSPAHKTSSGMRYSTFRVRNLDPFCFSSYICTVIVNGCDWYKLSFSGAVSLSWGFFPLFRCLCESSSSSWSRLPPLLPVDLLPAKSTQRDKVSDCVIINRNKCYSVVKDMLIIHEYPIMLLIE